MRILFAILVFWCAGAATAAQPSTRPNIVLILADDLGYGEVGCYGQKLIQTPNLDRLAREGLRFTRFYAGSTVCAPSRSVLMTGKHTGHATVRGNAGGTDRKPQMLRSDDVTVAEVLKNAGYATALIGKWGLGLPGDEGHPNKQGFDYFFGYLSQHHAHNHFPDHLWQNDERVPLPNKIVPIGQDGAGYATERIQYAGDLFAEEALRWIERVKEKPFFLFLSLVVPHANNERTRALGDGAEVPDFGPYQDRPWPPQLKGHAAMITRMDSDIGRIIHKLETEGLAQKTLVLFSSDNGPHKESGHDAGFFDPNGPLRGYKRDLHEGGIRVPGIAWWPGTVQPGVTGHVAYFGDFMQTAADLAGTMTPSNLDSISFLPTLLGHGGQKQHEYLYWEFHEGGFSQAVLIEGSWKGIRLKRRDAPIEVYDLHTDPGEQHNLAPARTELVRRIEELFQSARSDSPLWPIKETGRSKSRE